jgi:predicted dehydrogenase
MAAQIAKAAGNRVFVMDTNAEKISLARELGADGGALVGDDGCVESALAFSKGVGCDAVLILASTASNVPLETAARVSRDRGTIVAPGLVELDIPRELFYEKELSLTVPRAWGPGFDEESSDPVGGDYPHGYVRWTGQRNMAEALDLMADGKLSIAPLITDRFGIDEAEAAYRRILDDRTGNHIGSLISYGESEEGAAPVRSVQLKPASVGKPKDRVNVGLIGAGAFALGTMLPILKKLPSVNLKVVATTSGHSARHAGEKFGFERCVTDHRDVLDDPDVQCVAIATRHDQHARIAVEALNAGKDVFVEKPLALSLDELSAVIDAYRGSTAKIMVGFNRRFSPLAVRARELLCSIDEPLALMIRANVGFIPPDSWVHDPEQGGGRILGEVCHFVDLAQFLAGSSPVKVGAESIRGGSRYRPNENVAVTVGFDDGAVASIAYLASGDTSFPRERVEVFGGGAVCVIDNYRTLTFSRGGKRTRVRRLNKDSGHHAEFSAFFSAVLSGGDTPVPFEDYVRSTAATISIEQSLSEGIPVDVPTFP